jgi:hypothetical protein
MIEPFYLIPMNDTILDLPAFLPSRRAAGTRVMLRSNNKRYRGGPAIIVRAEGTAHDSR